VPKYFRLFERQIKTQQRGSNIYPVDPGYVTNLRNVFLLLTFLVNDTKMDSDGLNINYIDFVLTFKIS